MSRIGALIVGCCLALGAQAQPRAPGGQAQVVTNDPAAAAGMLAALKRLTEVLFERGLVQVVFATETMSLGIHMPARSVVIENLRKRTNEGFRTLRVGELTQMAGRAGRRGIDPQGTCLVAFDSRESLDEALRLIEGEPEPIESRFLFVDVAAQRANQLRRGARIRLRDEDGRHPHKLERVAMEEVRHRLVHYAVPELPGSRAPAE